MLLQQSSRPITGAAGLHASSPPPRPSLPGRRPPLQLDPDGRRVRSLDVPVPDRAQGKALPARPFVAGYRGLEPPAVEIAKGASPEQHPLPENSTGDGEAGLPI